MKIFALEILTTHPFQPLKKSSVLVEGGFPYPGRLGVYPDLHILKAGPYTRVYLPLTLSCPKTLFKRTTSDIISIIRVVLIPLFGRSPELVGLFGLPCTVSWLCDRPLNSNLIVFIEQLKLPCFCAKIALCKVLDEC